jgi:hypothetical protein
MSNTSIPLPPRRRQPAAERAAVATAHKVSLCGRLIRWMRANYQAARRREVEHSPVKGTLWEMIKFVPQMIAALFFGLCGLICALPIPGATERPFPLWVAWLMVLVVLVGVPLEAIKFLKEWPRARRERLRWKIR